MVKTASLDELDIARKTGAYVIDVREADEYAQGHVPGAQLLPLGIVPVRAHEVPKDAPVYVVCASGARSAQATEILQRTGVDARSVEGGTKGWISSGRGVDTGSPRS